MRRLFPRLSAVAGLVFLVVAGSAAPASAGPPWWRVSDGRAEVWIIGAPRVTPKAAFWDTASVERRLAGASQLIINVQPTNNIKALALLISAAHSSSPMLTELPPALRHRFEAASATVGQDPGHYGGWKPAVAGVFLVGDFYKANDLKNGEVDSVVRKLARKAGVPEVPAGAYDAGDMAAAAQTLSSAGGQVCLGATLQGMEIGVGRLRADSAAWAKGDPRPAAAEPSDLACLAAMPGMKALSERNLALEAGAVAAALRAPGRSLAVFDLPQLTMTGGVLDRLRARGLVVAGPLP
jgi:uncharacterized protein YbaP (TraB family)